MRTFPLVAAVSLCLGGWSLTAKADQPALEIFADAVNGDDSQSGLSADQAVQSLNAAQRLIEKTPEETRIILNLARGSVWRESYSPKVVDPRERPFFENLTVRPEGEVLNEAELFPDSPVRGGAFDFGRTGMIVRAYGKGDLPTLSGTDPLPNDKFTRMDKEQFPNVWSQKVVPPRTYWIRYHDAMTTRPGVIVGGERPLWQVFTPMGKIPGMRESVRDYASSIEGIETTEDAIRFVNENEGTFFAQDHGDGSFTYHINTGSDPTRDGLSYEYKVRGSQFAGTDSTWQNIRYFGLNNRDGLGGRPIALEGVEILFPDTHAMLIATGHFQDVVSVGYRPEIEGHPTRGNGTTHSVFHTHGSESPGIIYDRCIGRNANIAFYDHKADANRPAAVVRDCITENVRTVFGHGNCTDKLYLVGHRHTGPKTSSYSTMGGLAGRENYIEDSVFHFARAGNGQWHKGYGGHLRMRNSAIHVGAAGETPRVIRMGNAKGTDWVYENVTLVLDHCGHDANGEVALEEGKADAPDSDRGRWVIRNSVIAVINAPNMKEASDDSGVAMSFQRLQNLDLVLENVVITYVEDLPESTGVEGKNYFFAKSEEIFSGNPAEGDFTLREGSLAHKNDWGYREGREPVFRAAADKAALSISSE